MAKLETPENASLEAFEIRGPSMAIPKVSQSFHEEQDAPLLSIDYIHDSLTNANMHNSLGHDGNKDYGTSQDGGIRKVIPDAQYTDEEKSTSTFNIMKYVPTAGKKSSTFTQKQASIPSSIFNLCNTIVGAGILGMICVICDTMMTLWISHIFATI